MKNAIAAAAAGTMMFSIIGGVVGGHIGGSKNKMSRKGALIGASSAGALGAAVGAGLRMCGMFGSETEKKESLKQELTIGVAGAAGALVLGSLAPHVFPSNPILATISGAGIGASIPAMVGSTVECPKITAGTFP